MNRRNYQKELDAVIEEVRKAGKRPRLLLHVCCAPCSSYVLEYLTEYFDIDIFFCNPNIDAEDEYQKRLAELRRFLAETGLSGRVPVYDAGYDPARFYELAKGREKDPERGERCMRCYRLRLSETARFAAKRAAEGKPYDWYTTSLSISPLKDAEALNRIGEEEGALSGVPFLPSDFKKREGYKRSIELSREYGLYRQDYCGCIYSKAARDEHVRGDGSR